MSRFYKQFNDEEQGKWADWEGNSLTVLREDIERLFEREFSHKNLTKVGIRDWLYTIGIQPGTYLFYRHQPGGNNAYAGGGYMWRERIEFRFDDPSSIAFIKMSIGSDLTMQETPVVRVFPAS